MIKKAFSFIAIILLPLFTPVVPLQIYADDVQPPDINSQAAIVIDFDTGDVLFEKDAHAAKVPASLTKIMTTFIVYEEIENGNLALDTLIPISDYASEQYTSPNMEGNPLVNGSFHSLDTLLHLIMVPSSNGACVAVAEYISGSEDAFVSRMNDTAKGLGLFSDFKNPHGVYAHDTNAYSMGMLVRELILRYPDVLRITSSRSIQFGGRTVLNTNLLYTRFPYAYADGFKTGTSSEAGFCLSSTAMRAGKRIVAVVMGAPDDEVRYEDSRVLLEYGFDETKRRDEIMKTAESDKAEQDLISIIPAITLLAVLAFGIYIVGIHSILPSRKRKYEEGVMQAIESLKASIDILVGREELMSEALRQSNDDQTAIDVKHLTTHESNLDFGSSLKES